MRAKGLARDVRGAIALGVVAVVTAVAMGDMRAQTPPPPASGSAAAAAASPAPAKDDGYGAATDEEREALALMREEKLLGARTKAEEVLKKDPDSLIGHFVMGTALREAEGALARAMAHFKRGREVFEQRYGSAEGPGRPWRVYADTLFAIAITAQLLEDFEGSLRAMDDFDERFQPKLTAQRVWPLMKMGRFAEARQWAKAAMENPSPNQKLRAMNGMCAVEAEERTRVPAYDACLATYKLAKERQAASGESDPAKRPGIVVYANNAHLGALGVLKYDEAEQLAVEGTKSVEETSSNPWLRLARIYIDQGRPSEAVSATKALQAWRVQQPPSTREQFRAEDESTVALLLLAAGEAEAALKLADRVLERPDRRGMISTKPEQTLGANALIRRAIARLGSELASERATFSGWKAAPGLLTESARLAASGWPDAQRVVGTLLDEERLVATLRIYLAGGIEYLPTWLIGELVEVLGPGVFLVALDEARAKETEMREQLDPFYDGLEAEARLAQGQNGAALMLAKRAIDRLPKAEALFKARVAAVGAEAARRTGQMEVSLALFEGAMLGDPGVVRRMGLALPVEIRVPSGGEAAGEAAKLLRRSPRLDTSGSGFVVTVNEDGRDVEVCLRTPLDADLGCARVPITPPAPKAAPKAGEAAGDASGGGGAKASAPEPAGPTSPGERAAEAFHKTIFALKMNLSDSDLRSLDGGTTASRDAARERMRELLGDEGSKEPDAPKPKE